MYFAGLKRIIQNLEEKIFYDIAIMFLGYEGYKELAIIDGSGDGGRDVTCSRTDLRIQLSVRKDWKSKINDEANLTRAGGKRHFIYVTNRLIREQEKVSFIANDYTQKGEVELSIFDLNRISTALAMPGVIQKSYERLGMITDKKISATPKEIALSNLLLFSKEAQDLRQNVIESNIKAQLYKSSVSKKNEVVTNIAALLPGVDIEHNVSAVFDSLRSRGEITNQNGELALSEEQSKYMAAAEEEYLQSTNSDISLLMGKYKLSDTDARQLIEMALEIAAREASLDGDGLQEVVLQEYISNKGLIRKRKDLYEDLSKLAVARITQYGKTVDHIFSTNTFDIYRALGRNSDVIMVLDSSVAMPLMFGLSFGSEKSRYGIAAAVLNDLCREHNIKVIVPRCYLNEMAFHGKKAFEFIDMYNELDDDLKAILKSSGNAYLSHFSHIRENEGLTYTLSEFLKYFGLSNNSKLSFIENSIESILDSFGIGVLSTGEYNQEIRDQISYRKQNAPPKIIDHDASVCTFLKNESNTGYIMATWDKVIIDVVEGLSRVLADTPARVIDFLSMAGGAQYESEQSFNLLTSLIYIDERKASALASKIEQINSVDKMHELKKFVDAARLKHGDTAQFVESSLEEFFVNQ